MTHLMPFSFAHSMNAAVRFNLEAVVVPPPPTTLSTEDAVAFSTADNDRYVNDGRDGGRRRRWSTTVMATVVAGDNDARDGAMPANAAASAPERRERGSTNRTRADIIVIGAVHANRCVVARLLVENRTMLNNN